MSINYDFADLEAFLAVKDLGSFHKAAERLNLSQSAVTRRIRKLEEALDSQLFERTTRAVKPTLAAKRLQARAEAILEDARETARAMRDESVAFAYQRGAVVTVATIPTVISHLLTPALKRFHAAGHSTRIRLIDAAANEVTEAVTEGEADFGLCSIPMLEPATAFETLLEERIMLALPPDHPAAQAARIDLNRLRDTPLILPARGTGNRLLIDEAAARARLDLRWSYEAGRSTTALSMVRDGIGAALLPEAVIRAAALPAVPLVAPDIARPVGLLSRLGQTETPAVTALKAQIRAVAAGN